jgi:NAD(P)-dependent dehydrogenase (short-subunit alcohol dehydrogenase family)
MSTASGTGLSGKRVLITGGSSGIGLATAKLFAREGARVAIVGRRVEALREAAAACGKDVLAIPADVADADQAAAAVKAAIAAFGGLDILVNAAGIVVPSTLAELTPERWRAVIDVNLSGTFYMAREAGLHMREAGAGTIVNVGSELSSIGMPMFADYCASKFGVIGLTKALALELAPTVTVNAIAPGPVDTPMMAGELALAADPVAALDEAKQRVPLRRFATAEEVAAGIRYLAVEAGFATGSVLGLDGGTTAG